MFRILRGLLAVGCLSVSAHAGSILMWSDALSPVAFQVDSATGVATPIANTGTAASAWGAAYNPSSATLYWNSGSTLYTALNYTGGPLTASTSITMTLSTETRNFVSLAYDTASGVLLGTRNIATVGLHTINPSTGEVALLAATPFTIDGMDFEPLTGHLYGTTDSGSSNYAPGLYRIDNYLSGTPSYTLVASYPTGVTDIDGIAAGEGRVYLVLDEPSPIYVFNLQTDSYENSIAGPFTATGVFSAGAYISSAENNSVPEPGTFALAGLSLALAAAWRAHRRLNS
ncbi:MAG: PEP-CTERM sorting domain-containing protein [Pirellulaceae bacterium]|nr:PEP-CTERM sorting domain-containing protein [Pirellulaceae bacterium]